MKMLLTTQVKILVIFLSLLSFSCSSNYANNRILDARDIFSFSVGYGLGAQARVSYLAEGLLIKKDVAGLQNGIIDWYGFDANVLDVDVALGRLHVFNPSYNVYVRKHGVLLAEGPGPLYFPKTTKNQQLWNPKWATQIDGTLAIGLSVQVGFNAGELVDFIVGFFAWDLYGDDYAPDDFVEKTDEVESTTKPSPK